MTGTRAERMLRPFAASAIAYWDASDTDRRGMYRAARREQRTYRLERFGFTANAAVLTDPESQPKLAKSVRPTYGLTLLPAREAGIAGVNLCPWAGVCLTGCLETSGRGRADTVRSGRMARTWFLFERPTHAGVLFAHEVLAVVAKHGKGATNLRLNVLSDIRWELVSPEFVTRLQDMTTLYDYSKAPERSGYHVTYSADGQDVAWIRAHVSAGRNVAVITDGSKDDVKSYVSAGRMWHGMATFDGVSTDDRSTDGRGGVVLLAALGDLRAMLDRGVRPGNVYALA